LNLHNNKKYTWEVFSIAGQLITKGSSPTINISNQVDGIYLLKIKSQNNSQLFKLQKL